jgi:5'-nucleotidase
VTRRRYAIVPVIALTCAMSVGCNMMKKKDASTMPAKSASALNIPATPAQTAPAAPAAQYTLPPQPVVYDPPAAQQPVIGEAATADASDASYAAAPANPTPTRKVSSSARATKASASGGGSKYTVKKGDSLWTIAVAKYGNGNKWKSIAAANPKIDPNHVRAGQTITLP